MMWYLAIGVVVISVGVSLLAGALIKWADAEDVL